MWEAATGKRLWKGVPDITILQRLLSGEIPTPRSIKPEVPEKLEAIILKALSHQRDDRYETAADLQNAIDAYLEECGERVSARDVGKLIATHFEADRQKIKGIIEEQLRAKTVEAFSLPVIDQHTHSGSGSGNATRADRGSHSSVSDAIKAEAGGQSSGSTSYTGPNVLFASSATAPNEASRGRRGLFAGAALAAGALAAVVFWQMTKSPPPAPPQPVTGATQQPAVPTPPPAATDVEVNIAAYPQEAKLFLDDRLLVSNPFKAKLARDAGAHHLRIEAPGFVTQTKDIVLDKDSMLEVSLAKDPNAAAADKQAKPGVVPVAPVDPMAPQTKKPIHQVDTSNPYGH
jgi:serine/threonine-protein kinase